MLDNEALPEGAQSIPTHNLQTLAHYAIDGLSAHIAILDETGVIIATNQAWNQFALSNLPVNQDAIGVGANYLTVCDQATGDCAQDARDFAAGIRAVIAGEKPSFALEYPCHSPTEQRWFMGRVTRSVGENALYVIVAHENITGEKLAKDQAHEQERTLRSFYDSAPMMMGIVELLAEDLLHISGNVAASRFFGVMPESPQNQEESFLSVPPEHLSTWICRCQDSVRTGLPSRFVYQHATDGEARSFAVTVCFIAHSPAGRPRFSYIAEDITERISAEQEMRLFAAVVHESLSGIIITDPQERTLYVNPAFERLTGYTLEELRGKRPGPILQGEGTDPETKRRMQETLRARKPISVELLNYTKSGQPYWIEMHIAPVFDKAGSLTHFVAIENDATRRRTAEEALRRSEARLEDAQRIAHLGSWEFDVVTQKITWSKELFYLSGRAPEQGEPTYEENLALYPPEDARRLNRLVTRAINRGIGYKVDLRRILPDGTARWYHAIANTIKDESGRVIRLVGTLLDITERRQVEEALRRSEALLEEAQRIAHVGSWERNLTTGKIVWSQELFRLYGLDPKQGPPPYDEYLALYPPDDRAVLLQLMARTEEGMDYAVDLRRILPDGSTRWLHVIGNKTKIVDGDVIRVGAMVDITERKEAEQELARLNDRLRIARERETAISARVQSMLLAPMIPQDLPGARIAALSLPSQQVDGDFSDFIVHSATLFDLIVGDVMGKGIGTALLGAAAKSLFLRSFIHLIDSAAEPVIPAPEAVVGRVHEMLTPRLIKLETFITATFVRFDLANEHAILVDCGHTSTIHYRARSNDYRFVRGNGLPLGVQEEERYSQIRISIAPGDLFVFYSDGITEAQDPEGNMYGEDRLMDLLRSHHYETPEQLIETLQHSLQEYASAASFIDDVTCIVVAIQECGVPALVN